MLKLVVRRVLNPKLVHLDSSTADVQLAWLGMWWEPSEEDYKYDKRGRKTGPYRGGEGSFSELVSNIVPDDCAVYSGLDVTFEANGMIRQFREQGVSFETEPSGKSFWGRVRKPEVVYAVTDKKFVVNCFKHYISWQSASWIFLVSSKPLADWIPKLRAVSKSRTITRQLLDEIDIFLTNEYEHGFYLASAKLTFDQLRIIAEKAGNAVGWKTEII